MTQAEARERGQDAAQPALAPSTGTATVVTEQGRTTIAPVVVATIAGLAAREIAGVQHLVGGAAFGSRARAVSGAQARDRGVRVEVGGQEGQVELRLIVAYGASIPQVAQAVRATIIARVRDLTGLIVREVNIDVVDLSFPSEERHGPQPAQPTPSPRVT